MDRLSERALATRLFMSDGLGRPLDLFLSSAKPRGTDGIRTLSALGLHHCGVLIRHFDKLDMPPIKLIDLASLLNRTGQQYALLPQFRDLCRSALDTVHWELDVDDSETGALFQSFLIALEGFNDPLVSALLFELRLNSMRSALDEEEELYIPSEIGVMKAFQGIPLRITETWVAALIRTIPVLNNVLSLYHIPKERKPYAARLFRNLSAVLSSYINLGDGVTRRRLRKCVAQFVSFSHAEASQRGVVFDDKVNGENRVTALLNLWARRTFCPPLGSWQGAQDAYLPLRAVTVEDDAASEAVTAEFENDEPEFEA